MPWIAGHNTRYNEGTSQADNNAMMIAEILCNNGFSAMSASAVLGNIQHEGIMNPWYWEENNTPTQIYFETHQSEFDTVGYGLFQFTNPNKYINSANSGLDGYAPHFSDVQGNASDGNAQVLFMLEDIRTSDWSTNQYGYYAPGFADSTIPSGPGLAPFSKDISVFYGTSVDDFIEGIAQGSTIEEQIENLTGVFELQYEAPSMRADQNYPAKKSYWSRVYSAYYYYDLIKDAFAWQGQSRFKIFMYLRPWWKGRI